MERLLRKWDIFFSIVPKTYIPSLVHPSLAGDAVKFVASSTLESECNSADQAEGEATYANVLAYSSTANGWGKTSVAPIFHIGGTDKVCYKIAGASYDLLPDETRNQTIKMAHKK